MWMASSLTIPLYKLMCNLSNLELEFFFSFFCKELNLFNYIFFSNSKYSFLTFFFTNKEMDLYLYSNNMNLSDIFLLNNLNLIENKEICSLNVLYGIKKQIILENYVEIKFFSKVSNFSLLEFKSLQESIIICPGETGLVFFRLFNPMNYELTGMSLYFIYPNNISIYIHKIQCFCFDLIKIKANESIELPILFYLDTLLSFDNNIFDRLIYISYIFFLS